MCEASQLVGRAFAHANREFFEIVWLPTASNHEPRTLRRTSETTGMKICDLAMDPTQDVIALLEVDPAPLIAAEPLILRVHIRTISTDTIHPRARHSFLQLSVSSKRNFGIVPLYHVSMQFARDTLVLYFCTDVRIQPYIQIWDWTTGEVISDCSRLFDPSIARRYQFGLLDSTYCFVASTIIRLYKLVRSTTTTPCAAVPLAMLYLPQKTSNTNILNVAAHAAPIEAHPLPGVPFGQNDGDRLHVFMLDYATLVYDEQIHTTLNMFVHQRVFMKYCKRWEGGAPLKIPWEEWGPANTRLVCYPAWVHQEHWMGNIHGQRVICPSTIWDLYHGDDEDPTTVKVVDFSLAAVLSAQQQQQRPPKSPVDTTRHSGCLLRTSAIPALEGGLFKEDVETHLPCVVTEWPVRREYSAYMIHADGFVGVATKRYRSQLLHVYPV